MIVFRYLYREIAWTALVVAAVLELIFISNRFVRYLADAAAGEIAGEFLLMLLGLQILVSLPLLIPVSLFIGALLAFGRMYAESELTVLHACGLGRMQILRLLLPLLGVGMLLVAVVSLWLGPWAIAFEKNLEQVASQQAQLNLFAPGQFQSARDGQRSVYVEEISEDGRLQNVFISGRLSEANRQQQRAVVIASAQGYQHVDQATGERYMVLEDGYRYEGAPGQPDYNVTHFERYLVRVADGSGGAKRVKDKALPLATLWQRQDAAAWAEIHWRIAMPLSVLVLVVLALPLSWVNPRQGRFGRIIPAVLLYFVYYNLLILARTHMEDGDLPTWLGFWWIHGLFLLIGFGWLLEWPRQWRRRAV